MGRRGFSNVTSTVILSSVLLTIMITASYLASDILTIQVAASEFKTAENLIFSIDSEINRLIFKPGSSTIIKTSFSNTAPGFTRTGEPLNISFEDATQSYNYSIDINIFNIDGRRVLGGAFDYDLQGDASLIVSPYNGTMGRIRISRPRKLRASLDYERVLLTFTGILNFFNGSAYVPHNTLEVTSIALSFGSFDVSGNSIIVIQNEEVVTNTLRLQGDCSITVSTSSGSETKGIAELGGDPAYQTLVNFHRVYIKISVLGGG